MIPGDSEFGDFRISLGCRCQCFSASGPPRQGHFPPLPLRPTLRSHTPTALPTGCHRKPRIASVCCCATCGAYKQRKWSTNLTTERRLRLKFVSQQQLNLLPTLRCAALCCAFVRVCPLVEGYERVWMSAFDRLFAAATAGGLFGGKN